MIKDAIIGLRGMVGRRQISTIADQLQILETKIFKPERVVISPIDQVRIVGVFINDKAVSSPKFYIEKNGGVSLQVGDVVDWPLMKKGDAIVFQVKGRTTGEAHISVLGNLDYAWEATEGA